MKTKLRNHTN